jgi:putative ABC transport system ATP-binding protein
MSLSDQSTTNMAIETNHKPILRIEHVSRVFRMGDVEVPALRDVNLAIEPGEFVVILGPSGSGKSTLLNLIGGMDRPTTGQVWYQDRNLAVATDEEMTAYRREKVGFIFQFYNLVPTLTAYENVQVATELAVNPVPPPQALEMVELAHRTEHFPAQLSGGEQQRIAIARALAKRPELILADEPTGALDLTMARHVLSILQRLNREQRLTVILITHNPALGEVADRVIRLVSGHIAEDRRNERPIFAAEVEW